MDKSTWEMYLHPVDARGYLSLGISIAFVGIIIIVLLRVLLPILIIVGLGVIIYAIAKRTKEV